MSQLVHVITPSGMHYEIGFGPRDMPETIYAALARTKWVYGYNVVVPCIDESGVQTVFQDTESGFVFDHAETIVAIGKVGPGHTFVETKRIAGPGVEKPKLADSVGYRSVGEMREAMERKRAERIAAEEAAAKGVTPVPTPTEPTGEPVKTVAEIRAEEGLS